MRSHDRQELHRPRKSSAARRLPFPAASLVAGIFSAGWLSLIVFSAVAGATEVPAAPAATANSDFDDPAQPLVPKGSRSELENDRLQATALFASARTNEQRQEYATALKQYERALRYDPRALPALREVVALAFNLDRRSEAARYAQLIVPKDADDAILLRRLGIELAEDGEWEGALKLYEKVAAIQVAEKPSANTVLWWMEMGRLYYLTKQYVAAAKQFEHVIDALSRPEAFGLNDTMRKAILGTGDLTYQLFGECFLESGQSEQARTAFAKSNELKENPGLLAYNLARVAVKDKQPQAAIEKLDFYFHEHLASQGTGPYQLLAEAFKDLGRQEQLLARLEMLQADDPDNMPLAYSLAEQYRQAGQADKAEPLYRKLCAPGAKRSPVDAYQALVVLLYKQARWNDLLELLGDVAGKIGAFDPLGAEGKQVLGDKPAVEALLTVAGQKKLAATDDTSSGLWLAAALLAIESAKYADADDYFARAVKADPKKAAELTLTWGLELLTHSQFKDAAKVFQTGIDEAVLPAENPAFHFYLAGTLEMEGQTEQALIEARKAAELQKDSARFQSRVGWIQYHAKRYAEARASYEDLLKRFDGIYDSNEVRDVMHDARLALSNIDAIEHHSRAAEEWLEQLLDEFPNDAGALNDLGYLWTDRNQHLERALRMIEQAVAAEPDNLAYRDSRGWAYYRLGRFPEAVSELEAATAVETPDGVALDHLGDALSASGNREAAVTAWSKAVATFDKEGDMPKSKQTQEKIGKVPGGQ
jgi:tetratricopeptide (TPR) repeat protein